MVARSQGRKVEDFSEDELEIVVADEEAKNPPEPLETAGNRRVRARHRHRLTATVLAQLLKIGMVVTILARLRRRWKWLAACVAATLAAIYLHAEFLDYVAALPAGSHQAVTASGYIPLAFVLKNTVIAASLVVLPYPSVQPPFGPIPSVFLPPQPRPAGRQPVSGLQPAVPVFRRMYFSFWDFSTAISSFNSPTWPASMSSGSEPGNRDRISLVLGSVFLDVLPLDQVRPASSVGLGDYERIDAGRVGSPTLDGWPFQGMAEPIHSNYTGEVVPS